MSIFVATFLLLSCSALASATKRAEFFHSGPRIEEGDFKKAEPQASPSSQQSPEPAPVLVHSPSPEPSPIFRLPVTEVVQKLYYPLHSTPESLSSVTYGYANNVHYVIPRVQFHLGQYQFLEDLYPQLKTYLVLQPRVNVAIVYTSEKQLSYYLSSDNRFKVGEYGVGFKVLVEATGIDFDKSKYNGILTCYAYKNFDIGSFGKMSVYLGFSGDRISISKEPYKYADQAKNLLFNSKKVTVGFFYNPNVLKKISFSLESNAKDFVFLSLYYPLN